MPMTVTSPRTQKRKGTPCGRTNILPCVPEFDLLPTVPCIEPSESIKTGEPMALMPLNKMSLSCGLCSLVFILCL